MALPGKRMVRELIKNHGGVISEMARNCEYGGKKSVSRQTIYNWIDHYQLRGHCEAVRVSMRMVSRDVIYQRLMGDDDDAAFDAAKFVTLHLDDVGELLYLDPEIMGMLKELDIPMSFVAQRFEQIIRATHMESVDQEEYDE